MRKCVLRFVVGRVLQGVSQAGTARDRLCGVLQHFGTLLLGSLQVGL